MYLFIAKVWNPLFVWHASHGPAPLVAMETPLGSGAASMFVFLCIAPRQAALLVGDSPVPTAYVGGWMGARLSDWASGREKQRERQKEREREVGGIVTVNQNKKRGQVT